MTLPERLQSETTVSLASLLAADKPEIDGTTELGLAAYTDEIIRSGFPAIRALSGRALRTRLQGYVSRVIDRDFKNELGEIVRRPRHAAAVDGCLRSRDGHHHERREDPFESLATLSVRVFAQAAEADVYHLRSPDGGREVDLIVENRPGDVIAFEIPRVDRLAGLRRPPVAQLRGALGVELAQERLRRGVVLGHQPRSLAGELVPDLLELGEMLVGGG